MNAKNRKKLAARVARAAQAEFALQPCVSPIEVLASAGLLRRERLSEWREGRIDDPEPVFRAPFKRISLALELFRSWAVREALAERDHVPRGRSLRIGKSGCEAIERADCTRWAPSERIASKRAKRRAKKRARALEALASNVEAHAAFQGPSQRKRETKARKRWEPEPDGAAISRSKRASNARRRREPAEFSLAEWGIELEMQRFIEAAAWRKHGSAP